MTGTQHNSCSTLFVRCIEHLYTRKPGPGPGSALDGYMALDIKDLLGSKKIPFIIETYLYKAKTLGTKGGGWGSDPFIDLPFNEGLVLEAGVQAMSRTQGP